MLIIKVGKNEHIDKALKRYKHKVIKTKQMKEIRERQEFTKKSQRKRKKIEKAKYVQKMRDNEYDK